MGIACWGNVARSCTAPTHMTEESEDVGAGNRARFLWGGLPPMANRASLESVGGIGSRIHQCAARGAEHQATVHSFCDICFLVATLYTARAFLTQNALDGESRPWGTCCRIKAPYCF